MKKRIEIYKDVFDTFKDIAKVDHIHYDMQEYKQAYIGTITATDENAMLYFFYTCGRMGVQILIQQ